MVECMLWCNIMAIELAVASGHAAHALWHSTSPALRMHACMHACRAKCSGLPWPACAAVSAVLLPRVLKHVERLDMASGSGGHVEQLLQALKPCAA